MPTGDFDDFLNALLAFESGVDPSKADEYKSKYDQSDATKYWKVKSPGVPLFEGGEIKPPKPVSYREYFRRIGVDKIYADESLSIPERFKLMQCASINCLGFVGYQVGEFMAFEAGCYIPPTKEFKTPSGEKVSGPSYYVFIPFDSPYYHQFDSEGDTTPFRWSDDSQWILATAYNKWGGGWTGKHGIKSLEDLKKPEKGKCVIKDIVVRNKSVLARVARGGSKKSDSEMLHRIGEFLRGAMTRS